MNLNHILVNQTGVNVLVCFIMMILNLWESKFLSGIQIQKKKIKKRQNLIQIKLNICIKILLPHLIRKVYDFANTEQYKVSSKKRNSETPTPNTYWDDGKSKVKIRKNVEEEQAQKWVIPREKTYKKLYISGMRKSVY